MDSFYSSYNTMLNIVQEMFGDSIDRSEEKQVEKVGYQDDRRQLSLPASQGSRR